MRYALGLVVLLGVAAEREADAMCGRGGWSTTAPASGAVLPANPTLYVFTMDGSEPSMRVTDLAGRGIAAQIERVGESWAYDVYAVRPRIRRGALRVEFEDGREPAFFDVSPSVAVTPTLSVGMPTYRNARWTCSHTDAVMVPLVGNAIAHRIEWQQDGTTKVAYLPRDQNDLFGPPYFEGGRYTWARSAAEVRARRERADRPTEQRQASTIALGHVDCFGATVPENAFRWPTVVRVFGLHADGTEHDGGVIVAFRIGEIARDPGIRVEAVAVPELFDEATIFQAADAQHLRQTRLAALALAAVLAALLAVLVHRRRTQRPAVW